MAWGKKLYCSLVVADRMLRYLLPDGRGEKNLCEEWEGWEGSSTMLVALRMQRVV